MKTTLIIALSIGLFAQTALLAQDPNNLSLDDIDSIDLGNIDLGDFDIDDMERIQEEGYHTKGRLSEGFVVAEKDKKYGFLDKDLKVAIPFIYKDAKPFYDGVGLTWVEKSTGWGLIDKTGKELGAFVYTPISSFSEGLAVVSKNGKCGYINMEGELVIPATFGMAGPFHEGFARVRGKIDKVLGRQYGFIDKTGEIVIPEMYDNVDDFSEGLAAVGTGSGKEAKNITWNYINTKGELVIETDYDEAGAFYKGKATVKIGGKTMVIDKTGKCLEGCD